MPLTPPESPPHPFPGADSLCESCGYPLKGLAPQGDCPECGHPIEASDPRHRAGLPFEFNTTPASYLKTAYLILRHPKRSGKQILVGQPNHNPLVFLFWNATLAAIVWLAFYAIPLPRTLTGSWRFTDRWEAVAITFLLISFAIPAVLWLTTIEALGVTAFSRRKGWRIPFRLAQRVTCFASIGWVPGAAFLGLVMNLERSGAIQDAWSAVGGPWANSTDATAIATIIAGVLAMLCFELLVWVSVRQVKYANSSA